MDQKFRRRKVGEKLSLVPGKLDHATVAAYSVADRTKTLQSYTGKNRSFSFKNHSYSGKINHTVVKSNIYK